jgi:hypothetical protein
VSHCDHFVAVPTVRPRTAAGALRRAAATCEWTGAVGRGAAANQFSSAPPQRGSRRAPEHPPDIVDQFAGHLLWFSETPVIPGRGYLLKIGTRTTPVSVHAIGRHVAVRTLELNDSGYCNFAVPTPSRSMLRVQQGHRQLHFHRSIHERRRGRRH